jgi:hypothetical protein
MTYNYRLSLLQPKAIVQYTWDASVTTDVARGPRLDTTATGITSLTPPNECKERSCISVPSGGFLRIPQVNVGQYPALTFALWFKPLSGCGSFARLVDLGNGQNQDNIVIGRSGVSDALLVAVVRGGAQTQHVISEPLWTNGVWRHFAWSLAPINATYAIWSVYVDGVLKASVAGLYPSDTKLSSNYIAKSNWAAHGVFVGLLDSFVVYSDALKPSDVLAMTKVWSTYMCVFVCVCMYQYFSDAYVCASYSMVTGC